MVKDLSYAIIRTLGANKLFSKWIGVCADFSSFILFLRIVALRTSAFQLFFANLYIFPVLSFLPLFVCCLSKEISASL